MRINKLFYYLRSLNTLIWNTRNVGDLMWFLLHKNNIITLKNGLRFKAQSPLDLLIIKETICDDFYLLRKVKMPKIIVDIGAGFGDFSIFASRMFPNATVYAFEPNPSLFKLLQENIKRNDIHNIIVSPYAVSNKKEIDLYFPSEPTQSSYSDKIASDHKVRVKGIPLSSLLTKQKIDFLKMDCEGGEWNIIRFLTEAEKNKINVISMEYHNMYIENVDEKIKKKLSPHFKVTVKPNSYTKDFGHLYAKNTK